MKTLKCSDMGATSCDFVASGNTNEEAKQVMWNHAQSAHPDIMGGMDDAKHAEMDSLMDSKIQG